MIALDANILVRMSDNLSADYALTRAAVLKLARTDKLAIFPQTLFEFWAVATRPKGDPNGLSLPVQSAAQWLNAYRRMFLLLPDKVELVERWQSLVTDNAIVGLKAHDARYAAAMQCYGISQLLTYNERHFVRLGIVILDPATV